MSDTINITEVNKGEYQFNSQDLPGRPEVEKLRSVVYTPSNATGEFLSISDLNTSGSDHSWAALQATWWHHFGFVSFESNGNRVRYTGANPDRLNGWDGMIHASLIGEALSDPKLTLNARYFTVAGETFKAPVRPDGNGGWEVRRESEANGWFAVYKTVMGYELHMPRRNNRGEFPAVLRTLYTKALTNGTRVSVDVTTRWWTNTETGERVLLCKLQDYAQRVQHWSTLPVADALAQIRKETAERFETQALDQKLAATVTDAVPVDHKPTKKQSAIVLTVDGAKLSLEDIQDGEYEVRFNGRTIHRYLGIAFGQKGRILNLANHYGKGLELKTL